jgi:hypothetical protein
LAAAVVPVATVGSCSATAELEALAELARPEGSPVVPVVPVGWFLH